MFNCEECGKTSKTGEKQSKVVVETRPKTYANGQEVTLGYETVKEKVLCHQCKEKL